jgi:hypothetical protein
MAVEHERGISASASTVVMSFEHEGLAFDLLDTAWLRLSVSQPCGCHNRMVLSRPRSGGLFALEGVGDT